MAVRFYFCTFRFLPRGRPATAESSGIRKASWPGDRMWGLGFPPPRGSARLPGLGTPAVREGLG